MSARVWLLALALALGACSGAGFRGDGPPRPGSIRVPDLPDDPEPRPEPRSRYGNGPVYEVFGKRYTVMPSSANYSERGVASWYGKKFHGNLTSNRETYDMYQMTAAHKTLPLPTYVRVRNLANNKAVTVRVNDRGPFIDNRIIDLSYAAAMKLGIIRNGTGMVEVTAINFDAPSGDRPTRQTMPPVAPMQTETVAQIEPQPAAVPDTAAGPAERGESTAQGRIYVQVGAFGERSNAERRHAMLLSAGIENSFIFEDRSGEELLLRVRIGPVQDVVQYDVLVEQLEAMGITDPYLIVD